jgi:hypothetical protein
VRTVALAAAIATSRLVGSEVLATRTFVATLAEAVADAATTIKADDEGDAADE